MPRRTFVLAALVSLASPVALTAQVTVDCSKMNLPSDHATMDRAAHQALMKACAAPAKLPTLPGQAAFGAISEIVGILKQDPSTDWSKVNIEALRQHLIDMDEVTMRAAVTERSVPAGFVADVTGAGKTIAADARDTTLVARIRGLGFAGIITEGDHHLRHHLAIARGDAAAHEH